MFALLVLLVTCATSRLIHPRVASLEHNFELCLNDVVVNETRVEVSWSPPETALSVAKAAVGNKRADEIAVFLEHRLSLALSVRADFRSAAGEVLAPAFYFTSQSCGAESVLDRSGPWFFVDFNTFHAANVNDWDFHLGNKRKASAVVLSCDAVRELQMRNELDKAEHLIRDRLAPGAVFLAHGIPGNDMTQDEILEAADAIVGREGECADGSRRIERRAARTLASATVINLKRRPDRWRTVQARAKLAGLPHLERLDAVDGADLLGSNITSDEVRAIFNLSSWRYGSAKNAHQDHGYRTHVIGCALSHLRAWERIAASSHGDDENSIHLVLEDDVHFSSDFAQRWPRALRELGQDNTWDLVHLGVLDDRDLYGDWQISQHFKRFSDRPRVFGAGAFAYLLRPRSARRLLFDAREQGIQQAVDWWLVDKFDQLVCYKASPPLASSPQGHGRDSDNDQSYDQRRLLLDVLDVGKIFDMEVSEPHAGATVGVNELFRVASSLQIAGRTDLFLLKHKLAQICTRAIRVPARTTEKIMCSDLSEQNALKFSLERAGWYELRVTIRDELLNNTLADAFVHVEAVDYNASFVSDEDDVFPASTTTYSLSVVLDGEEVGLECPDAPRDLYACVKAFCLDRSIQPQLDCRTKLAARFVAHMRGSSQL